MKPYHKDFVEFPVFDSKQGTVIVLPKQIVSAAKFTVLDNGCCLLTERGDIWISGQKEEILTKLGWLEKSIKNES